MHLACTFAIKYTCVCPGCSFSKIHAVCVCEAGMTGPMTRRAVMEEAAGIVRLMMVVKAKRVVNPKGVVKRVMKTKGMKKMKRVMVMREVMKTKRVVKKKVSSY